MVSRPLKHETHDAGAPVEEARSNLPRLRDRTTVYENSRFQVSRLYADFEDFTKEYYIVEHGQRAGLVVTRGEDILLVRQYRMLVNRLCWEIPGGGVREDEAPEDAAVRECLEETGMLCRNLRPLIKYEVGLDVVHNPTHIFHTDEFVGTGHNNGNGREVLGMAWVPLSECVDMIFSGRITDSFSIAALLSYRARAMDGQP